MKGRLGVARVSANTLNLQAVSPCVHPIAGDMVAHFLSVRPVGVQGEVVQKVTSHCLSGASMVSIATVIIWSSLI